MDERKILEDFPLPLARGYRRYLNAVEVKERHDLGFYLFEIYLKYASSWAIAAYLGQKERDHRVNAALKGLLRPSLGEWLRFLRECLGFLSGREGVDPAIASLVALLKKREFGWPTVLRLYNAMRALREPSARESASLEQLLEEVVAYRNRVVGHGAPLERGEYERFAGLFGPAFGELLARSPFLTARRLVKFDSIQVRDGSSVECGVVEHMGNQPVRRKEPLRVRYGESVPQAMQLHLLSEDGSFLSLDPLLVAHREDVYVLNEAQGAPEYLSYSTGERHRPSDLDGKQGELFEKILGYRVDSSRMSRMGEEVQAGVDAPASQSQDGERRIGPYRILREIGHGGMGTVFEAYQESLGRRVALKVLPGAFALDPKRLERFKREARATARIHHPSVIPIYEVGESQGVHYYAMELIDGPSLDHVIAERKAEAQKRRDKRGSSSSAEYVSSVVEQMVQLAEGLEEAHRQGLVHRDVKPSNILVDRSGRWVLVDFGLVHDVEAETITRSGELVGTLGYMSPEQLLRQTVDARSDVYGFGVTLYEALTLKAPFEAASDHELQRAILFDEPAPPRKLHSKINRDLETILLHALEKKPEKRYASAAEFRADLKRFLRYEPIQARPRSALTRMWSRARRHRTPIVAATAAILVLVVALLVWKSWPEKKLKLVNHRRLTSDSGLTKEPTLTPDGTFVAYASDRSGREDLDIWVQEVEGRGEPRRLTDHLADDREPAFSPDGKTIAFRSEREPSGVYVVPAQGGEAQLLAAGGYRPRYSPEGNWVAYSTVRTGDYFSTAFGKILVIAPSGGSTRELQGHLRIAQGPVWDPSGHLLLFLGGGVIDPANRSSDGEEDWWMARIDGSSVVQTGAIFALPPDRGGNRPLPGVWMSGNRVLCSSRRQADVGLFSVRLSKSGQIVGRSQILTQGTAQEEDPWATTTNRVAFTSVHLNVDIWALSLNSSTGTEVGNLHRITTGPSTDGQPIVTIDGLKLIYTSDRRGTLGVYLRDLQTSVEVELMTAPAGDRIYSALDHQGATFAVWSQGDRLLQLRPIAATSPTSAFTASGAPMDFSEDGSQLLYGTANSKGITGIDVLSMETGVRSRLLEHPTNNLYQAHVAPGGGWVTVIALNGQAARISEIWVAPYRKTAPVALADWIQVTDGLAWDDKPRWSPDGNIIYFSSDRDGFRCIWFQRLDPATKRPVGPPEALYHFHSARLSPMNIDLDLFEMSVARDKIVLSMGERTGNIWLAEMEEGY